MGLSKGPLNMDMGPIIMQGLANSMRGIGRMIYGMAEAHTQCEEDKSRLRETG